ncbi:hypothetical protein BJY52DRAFT_1227017 [Lactarius psammicola]|nr:hypothetical protein BJY52DRAFT_1227017 [Lactarius psammicola]
MYAITALFVSVLALASSLAGVVQATGPRTRCTETYDVPEGETCDTLGAKLGANQTAILLMNPTITCGGTLPAEELCIKAWQPTCSLNTTATSTTCDGLASQWNITRETFISYNDNVNDDCTDLIAGQPVCVFPLLKRLYATWR